MSAPIPETEPAEDESAETLLSSLKTISASERRRHASVFNYWLSICGDKPLPPIRDLDPLEISDAGPRSVLLEMIGGEDADIRHFGQAIKLGLEVEKVSDAPRPSLLSCIAGKLPIVASSRRPFVFEEAFEGETGTIRCWVTLLPFSAGGTLIDFVYGFVSLDPLPGAVEDSPEIGLEEAEAAVEPFPCESAQGPDSAPEISAGEEEEELLPAPDPAVEESPARPGVEAMGYAAKVIGSLQTVHGYYGTIVEADPDLADTPVAKDQTDGASSEPTGRLEARLAEVRDKANEARMAKLRANAALYEGLGAAYDFALDAEADADDYLKIVQAQGLKVQLRSPMAPVVRLAFDGLCDESTIAQLETVLAWALAQDLPRGSLAARIEAEGGIAPILDGRT